MKFKLDENLPLSAASLLRRDGHDVHTVFDESLDGELDEIIAKACLEERRILITLDLDFSDIRTYPPKNYHGIVLLRPQRQSEPRILKLLGTVLPVLQSEPVVGFLWIVEPAGLRIR